MKVTERIKRIPKEYKLEILFLLAVAIYYTAWAYIQPLGVSPDESMRYDVAKFIYGSGTLPRGDEPAIMNRTWGISYAYNPILSYMIAAAAMKAMSLFSTGPFKLLMAARMVSVAFGVGTVFFAIRIAKKSFNRRMGRLFVLVLAFIPNMAFLSSYVNTDAMGVFCTAAITYGWICALQDGWTKKNCVLLGVSIGLCALSYYNAYGFILCSILLFAATHLFGERRKWDVKGLFCKGMLISVLVLAICGWWFVRNYNLYDGDFLARRAMNECAEEHALEAYKPSQHDTPQDWGLTPIQMLFNREPLAYTWIDLVGRSFIGIFGAMSIAMARWYYLVWWMFFGVGFLGIFLTFRELFALRENGKWRDRGWVNWTMLLAAVIPNVLNVYYSYANDYQPQGRYSFPMIVPFLYFVVTGFDNVVKRRIKDVHKQELVFTHAGAFAVLLGLLSYVGTFLPAYVPLFA